MTQTSIDTAARAVSQTPGPLEAPEEGLTQGAPLSIRSLSGVPAVSVTIPSRELGTAELFKLPENVIGAYDHLAERFPHLKDQGKLFTLYEQTRRGVEEGIVGERIPRLIHRFGSFFHGESGKNAQNWKTTIGTPFALSIYLSTGNLLKIVGPDEPPVVSELRERIESSLDEQDRNLLAKGRGREAHERRAVIEQELSVYSEVLKRVQLGDTNETACFHVNNRLRTDLQPKQVSFWISQGVLPVHMALLLGEGRRQQTHRTKLPTGPDESFSYLLGAHLGSIRHESTTEQLEVIHDDPQVTERVQQALLERGIETEQKQNGKYQVRVRSASLTGMLYEQTDGNRSLPWAYLQSKKEKIAFMRGFTDVSAAVYTGKIRFTKAGGDSLFEEVALVLDDLGIGSRVSLSKGKEGLIISSPTDIKNFRKMVGPRYDELDEKLAEASRPGKRYQYTVPQYRKFLQYCRETCAVSPKEVGDAMRDAGIPINDRTVWNWMNGKDPTAAQVMAELDGYREERPHLAYYRRLAGAGFPRDQLYAMVELNE